jgi:hypothetical protein
MLLIGFLACASAVHPHEIHYDKVASSDIA